MTGILNSLVHLISAGPDITEDMTDAQSGEIEIAVWMCSTLLNNYCWFNLKR